MKTRNIEVPTGNICVIKGDKGLLELVSLGDYGKDHNIKADFLGLTKDINGVSCQKIMPLDAEKLSKLFSINKFICKITPLHDTKACQDHLMITTNGYDNYVPYRKTEQELKQAGFDVIVFIPSKDEDLGRITCGNVILSGSMPECKYKVIK